MRKHSIEDLKKLIIRKSEVDENGCWIWQGAHDRYGVAAAVELSSNYIPVKAHRISWAVFKNGGKLPESGMVVMHKCDVSLCVNPGCLKLGTQQENMQDYREKKRRAENARLEAIDEEAVELCRAANTAEVR